MKGLVKIVLARSLFVGVAFAGTALLMVLFGLVPERSVSEWGFVGLLLLLLSLFSGLTVTFYESRQR